MQLNDVYKPTGGEIKMKSLKINKIKENNIPIQLNSTIEKVYN
jgi:hypothetical protein